MTRRCVRCGVELRHQRRDAAYCSPHHRAAAHRDLQTIAKGAAYASDAEHRYDPGEHPSDPRREQRGAS